MREWLTRARDWLPDLVILDLILLNIAGCPEGGKRRRRAREFVTGSPDSDGIMLVDILRRVLVAGQHCVAGTVQPLVEGHVQHSARTQSPKVAVRWLCGELLRPREGRVRKSVVFG